MAELDPLAALDKKNFEAVCARLSDDEIEDAIVLVAGSLNLPALERDRRIRILAAKGKLTPEGVRRLVSRLQEYPSGCLNAIRVALSQELRPFARPPETSVEMEASAVFEPDIEIPRPIQPEEIARPAVLLIGDTSEHRNNIDLLGSHPELGLMRLPSLQELTTVGPQGICGIAVGPSVWSGLDAVAQVDLVRRIFDLSSFLYVKIPLKGLANGVPRQVQNLAKGPSPSEVTTRRLGPCDGVDINEYDLGPLLWRGAHLRRAESIGFRLLDLSDDQMMLLRLIATQDQCGTQAVIGVEKLLGGRSGAKVYLVECSAGHRTVVKFGTPESVRKEIDTYHRWIHSWDQGDANPTFHQHSSACAVQYRLQSQAGSSSHPAPTLNEALARLVGLEWGGQVEDSEQLQQDLLRSVELTIERLVALNRRRCTDALPRVAHNWPSNALAERGINLMGSRGALGDECLFARVKAASTELVPLSQVSHTHGDIHGGNILLVDRVPKFIDFEVSGPGNPFLDLARLDAVVRSIMRLLVPELDLVRIYRQIYVQGASFDEIAAELPVFDVSPACRLSLKTAVATRRAAVDLAEVYNASPSAYLTTVAVVAACSLSYLLPGSGVEKACLEAALSHNS